VRLSRFELLTSCLSKDKFERRFEIKDYDPVVMFVKRSGEAPEYWFDRAHVAETLAPMSLWEIKDDERKKAAAKK
jgi:hypothetical protein